MNWPWMQTASGKAFIPFWEGNRPADEQFDMRDVAHALARVSRYNGHYLPDHYSVAEHSVWVSLYCPYPLEGLLHDATEAYLNDMVRPIKENLPDYKHLETLVEERFVRWFRSEFNILLRYPWPKEVKRADLRVMLAERRDILSTPPQGWDVDSFGLQPTPSRILGLSAPWAQGLFAARFEQLTGRRIPGWRGRVIGSLASLVGRLTCSQ